MRTRSIVAGGVSVKVSENVYKSMPAEVQRLFIKVDNPLSEEVVGLFPETGASKATMRGHDDSGGSAARFFYNAGIDYTCSLCYGDYTKSYNGERLKCKNSASGAGRDTKQTTTNKDSAQTSAVANGQREKEGRSQNENSNVRNVKSYSGNLRETIENTVQTNVTQIPREKIVQLVRSVGNLCDSCATSFVQEVAEISSLDFSQEESRAMQDFIVNYRKCILIQSLAQYAEAMVSIDTTPTMESLSILFGSANRAITNYIQEIRKCIVFRYNIEIYIYRQRECLSTAF